MRIMAPHFFWLLLILPLLWGLGFFAHRRSVTFLRRLGYQKSGSVDRRFKVRSFIRVLLLNGILIFSVLALVDFHWGLEPEGSDKRNLDVALVVDVSHSMLAQDAGGSRLDRCRDGIFLLMENLSKARYSFTLFKGEPVLFIPLTEDIITLESFLHRMGPDYISAPGSDLEKAVLKGASTLPDNQERNRAVLLFTDGEGLEGNLLQAARVLYEKNIQLFTFGIGTEEGEVIRLSAGDILTDRDGETVVTRQKSELLRESAEMTGGSYLDLTEIQNLGEIEQILTEAYGQFESRGVGFSSTHRYRLFCFISFFLMLFYLLLGKLKWH
ncbi:MAG: VWA domain-containing protein [Spirochaetales bacterium]|nr:VWA domain-containing protein [Spirochaetales bacterium]